MSPVTFQIVSDLHLETHQSYDFTIKQTAPYLALLGDIGNVVDDGLFEFLKKQLTRYWAVFLLLGNHEPIGTSWVLAKRRVRDFADQMERLRTRSTIGRFVFLDQTRYDVNETMTVLGCTLFSDVSAEQAIAVKSRLVGFKQIQDWTVEDHVEAHKLDVQWLNAQVCNITREEPKRQIIIFTHHSPTQDLRTMGPGHIGSPVSSGFVTNLSVEECWKNHSVVLWGFGHTHFQCDFTDDFGKRIIANQKGTSQIPCNGFNAKKTFLIGEDSQKKTSGLI
ncbi:hypothetical protein F4805DRAFT_408436 [Annulohypoxylon moriforme]|nr:hypothetical protein F4805DRAFT_408436 [Annulohypoxylon moriforme]